MVLDFRDFCGGGGAVALLVSEFKGIEVGVGVGMVVLLGAGVVLVPAVVVVVVVVVGVSAAARAGARAGEVRVGLDGADGVYAGGGPFGAAAATAGNVVVVDA